MMIHSEKKTVKISGSFAFFRQVLLFLSVLLLLCPAPSFAWYTLQHPTIARAAIDALPLALQEVLEPYRDRILWESMSPDLLLKDWPNHEWNLHSSSADESSAPGQIDTLAHQAIALLREPSPDMATVADILGRLSHYLADLSQPLHTDNYDPDESWIHVPYEQDVYFRGNDFVGTTHGIRLRSDIRAAAITAAREANLFYQGIIDVYAGGEGYDRLQTVTRFCLQRSVENITDVWATIWYRAMAVEPITALHLNQADFHAGDMIRLTLTTLPGSNPEIRGDLYVALSSDHGENFQFFQTDGRLSAETKPFQRDFLPAATMEQILVDTPLYLDSAAGEYSVYAVLTLSGTSPVDQGNWLGEPAVVSFSIVPLPDPATLLAGLNDEPYMFPIAMASEEESTGLVLRRWDFVFLGEKLDNPMTAVDESQLDGFIPGKFDHILLYLGRDSRARPTFLELIASHAPYLRLVRFPETEPHYPAGSHPTLMVGINNILDYQTRSARRPTPALLERLDEAVEQLAIRVAQDLTTDIAYQMEYIWSGDFSDSEVHLIDDGAANGASCTDYLLNLLEEVAGVCIRGSRMNAAEITNYFLFDPIGSSMVVPDDFNPFPFPITLAGILNLGYYVVDPPPHLFRCDGSMETGVPAPSMLATSPQLTEIEPSLLPVCYAPLEER